VVSGRIIVGGFWQWGVAGGACYCWAGEQGCRAPANLVWKITVNYQKAGEQGCSPCKDDLIPLKQNDPKWGTQYIDSSNETIGVKGCLLTCFAMVSGTNPITENAKLTTMGAIKLTGDLNLQDAADWYGMKYKKYGTGELTEDQVMEILCQKGHVIAEVDSANSPGNSHFVAVTGMVFDSVLGKCRFTINDPAKKNAKIYLDQFTAIRSYRRLT
jgi:hypothetical protein